MSPLLSRRFLKPRFLNSGFYASLYHTIFNPSIASQQCINRNPGQNHSFTPFKRSQFGIYDIEFCKSVGSLSNFQLVGYISTSPSRLGQDKENKNQSSSNVGSGGGGISWVDLYLPRLVRPYAQLARLDKPIGTWLLLWPCVW